MSTSKDRTVELVWHLPTGQELFTLVHHAAALWSVAFTPEGDISVVATPDAQGIAEVFRFNGKVRQPALQVLPDAGGQCLFHSYP